MKAKIETVRQYYKYEYSSWTQPALSSNGIINKDYFAVYPSGEAASSYGYNAFDDSASTQWIPIGTSNPVGQYVIIYNPIQLRVTTITVTNRNQSSYAVTGGIIYGSNDNNNWVELTVFENTVTAAKGEWTIDLSSNTNYYKFYKFYISSGLYSSSYSCAIGEIKLTAMQRLKTEGTILDYDWYEDVPIYKLPAVITRKYYKRTIQTFNRPNLTWNGILGGDTFAVATNNFPWSSHSKAYQWFDGNTSSSQQGNGNAHTGGGYMIFYNPNPLRLYSTYGYAGYSGDWFDVYYYGSNDGANWTLIKSFSNGLRKTNVVESDTFYYYHKVYNKTGFSHDGNGYGGGLAELIITADEEVYTETGTPEDYDYYENVYTVRALTSNQ